MPAVEVQADEAVVIANTGGYKAGGARVVPEGAIRHGNADAADQCDQGGSSPT